jgi:hypothetical protein
MIDIRAAFASSKRLPYLSGGRSRRPLLLFGNFLKEDVGIFAWNYIPYPQSFVA